MTTTPRQVTLPSGTTRWEIVIDLPRAGGKRRQQRIRFRTEEEAQRKLEEVRVDLRRKEHIAPARVTVDQYMDEWERGYRRTRRGTEPRPGTRRAYKFQAAHIREFFGHMKITDIETADVERFVTWMEARTGAATTLVTLQLLKRVLKKATLSHLIRYNPADPVDAPPYLRTSRTVWTDDEARTFLAAADDTRLAAAWHLTMTGLRRGEVCGLRWEDIDLEAGTLAISRARVQNGTDITEGPTKSATGVRTLPLPHVLASRLQEFRLRQEVEAHDAGPAYKPSGYVAVDELGQPLPPAWYAHEFGRLAATAGLPRIRLHDARHSANSLMAGAGVEPHVRAAWLGHTMAVNVSTYTHVRPKDLLAARDALNLAYATTESGGRLIS